MTVANQVAGVPAGRALVVGGSMGGLFTALVLLRQGWDVRVFERASEELAGRGAGIVTHPQLWRALQTVGLDLSGDPGVQVARRITLDRDGSLLGELACPQTMTSWNRMFGALRAALPAGCYVLDKDLRRIEQDGRGVAAHFMDGTSAEGDLLVGADGLRSSVRAQFLDVQPAYAGYVAWRGLVDEAELSEPVHRAVFAEFGFCLPAGEQFLGYPVAGAGDDLRPGHRRYNFVWYRAADERVGLPDLLTDATGHTHTLSIPPPLIRAEVIAGMRQAATRVLAPPFAAIVHATARPFLQPVYDLESPQLVFGRVALVGDAAFVVRPHVGAGVTKACEDALSLADALRHALTVEAALHHYEAARLPAGQRIVQRARHLGAYMQTELRTEEERQAAARHHTPHAVMSETALLNF